MGINTNAIIFYGYCWDDEEELDEEVIELWGNDEPVLAGHHGSDSYRIPYLYIEESQKVARRGSPLSLNSNDGFGIVLPGENWDEQLRAFCERFSIEPPEGENQPGWWLVSWWG